MTQEVAARLIAENLPAIYGYAYSKLYDKSRAEDLAGEIVLAILESAEALRQEEAFWGFAWKVAENTFRTFLKRERLAAQCLSLEREGLTEVLVAACMIEVSDRATALLEKVTPAHLRPPCADIVKIHHRMDVAAFIMESLLADGKLTIPQEKTPIAVFGVK